MNILLNMGDDCIKLIIFEETLWSYGSTIWNSFLGLSL